MIMHIMTDRLSSLEVRQHLPQQPELDIRSYLERLYDLPLHWDRCLHGDLGYLPSGGVDVFFRPFGVTPHELRLDLTYLVNDLASIYSLPRRLTHHLISA